MCTIFTMHRWAYLLKQQTSITVYRLPTNKNKLLISVFPLQQTNRSCSFPLFSVYIYIYIYIYKMYILKRQHIYIDIDIDI